MPRVEHNGLKKELPATENKKNIRYSQKRYKLATRKINRMPLC
jgi:hypothetical protein